MWDWIKGITHVAKAAWVSVVMTVIFALAINLAQQSREIFLLAADRPLQLVMLTAATLILAGSSWFFARLMLRYRSPFETIFVAGKASNAYERTLAEAMTHLPRLLGALAFLAVAIALAKAAAVDGAPKLSLVVGAALNGVGAVLFYVVTRKVQWGSRPTANGIPTFSRTLTTLPTAFARVGLVLLVLSTVFFLGGWFLPVRFGWFFGSGAILALATSGWIAGFATLHVWQRNISAPLVVLIPALLLVFSLGNDNHDIRTLAGDNLADKRPTVAQAYARWVERHQTREAPLIIVATSGGGIRAAYWTVNVLGTLQDKYPHLRDDLFAISSVSGGSVGAAVFETLLADARMKDGKLVPTCAAGRFAQCGRAALSADFLAATLMSMFYPDLMQRFLPFPFLPDRAAALEESWEAGWNQVEGITADRLAMPLSRFWTDNGTDVALPALFLNSTSTVTGQRVITSTVKLDDDKIREANDLLATGNLNLRVSSAANNSARFPYVGPTGKYRADKADGIVDGGYFDNFGAVTALELIDMLQPMTAATGAGRPSGIVVIQISNDPLFVGKLVSRNPDLNKEDNEKCDHPVHAARGSNMAEQLTDPIKTFFSVWNGRAYYNAIDLRDRTYAIKGIYIHFRVMPNKKKVDDPPLGWTLSRESQRELDDQVETCQRPKMDALVQCFANWQSCLPKGSASAGGGAGTLAAQ